ncbi:MAG: RDD family protein [Victivallaceae bacterium]|nr:RDD family protein [Victivallaceae bacterium]
MRQWYYNVNDEQQGPVDEKELIDLFQNGNLRSDTLVWTSDLEQWEQANNIKGLIPDEFNPPLQQYHYQPQYTPSGSQVRPWIRYWARMIDIMIFSFILGITAALIYEPLLDIPDAVFGIILLFLYVFAEAAMLASWGATPGKAMLSVRLRNANGDKLSYGAALKRSFDVWARGLGVGIPIIALYTQINAYNRLTNEGMTAWDRDGDYTVQHRSIRIWRILLASFLVLCFLGIIALGVAEG